MTSNLATELRAIAPDTAVHLTWTNENTTTSTTGTVIDYDPDSAFRHVETPTENLLLIPTATEITVSELTPTTTHHRGTLTDLHYDERPTETVQITDEGVEVPSYLIGYTGFLTAETTHGKRTAVIREPGLNKHDCRVIGLLGLPRTCYHDKEITVRPSTRPIRQYKTIDKRTLTLTRARYRDLERLLTIVTQLTETVLTDHQLDTHTREQATDELTRLQNALIKTRIVLEPPRNTPTTDWETYADALTQIETLTTSLRTTLEADETLSAESKTEAQTHLQIESRLEMLQTLLTESPPNWGVMDD